MTELEAIRVLTDAVRWWGALGAVFTFHDFCYRVGNWTRRLPHPPILFPWVDAWAKVLVCTFLIGAGGAIPFFRDVNSPVLTIYMALMWPQIALAGWLYTASRSIRPVAMMRVAALALLLMIVASFVTLARFGR